jgi:hypothetical protein
VFEPLLLGIDAGVLGCDAVGLDVDGVSAAGIPG